MYLTRPLSQLLKSPESLTAQPEGPNSGYLVIQDEEPETNSCFGFCKNTILTELPFPQNKDLTVRYETGLGQNNHYDSLIPVVLVPVLNQPLSSNRYHAIVCHGEHKGEAFTCLREDDKTTSCFRRCIKGVKPKPLDPNNIYRQFHILPYEEVPISGTFFAASIAADGFPPYFLRQKGWTIRTKTPHNFNLETAQGLSSELRSRFPSSDLSQSCVVGKWHCPFMFVKEGTSMKDQMTKSMYYEVTLEQRWEQIFTYKKKNDYDHNSVVIDTLIEKEEAFVGGIKALWTEKNGVAWFKSYGGGGKEKSVRLRMEIVEKMKWEQERCGWVGGGERTAKISKEFKGSGDWSVFGCYVLVERFNLRRMDGSLVMCYDFKHFDVMKSKWELIN